mmetsp:Transcript_34256/g.80031  ORF Transcript_34256/g.80031 Transcript_34256/m.80031 type:complete len:205 (-) Transcript_34256:299-913(-)
MAKVNMDHIVWGDVESMTSCGDPTDGALSSDNDEDDDYSICDGESHCWAISSLAAPTKVKLLSITQLEQEQDWDSDGGVVCSHVSDGHQPRSETRLVSIGSAGHFAQQCRPCAWHWTATGCHAGSTCKYCHFCTEEDFRRRVKERKAARSQVWQARYAERYHHSIQRTHQLHDGDVALPAVSRPSHAHVHGRHRQQRGVQSQTS